MIAPMLAIYSIGIRKWWRAEAQGYTTDPADAGLFTAEEAAHHVARSDGSVACRPGFPWDEWLRPENRA